MKFLSRFVCWAALAGLCVAPAVGCSSSSTTKADAPKPDSKVTKDNFDKAKDKKEKKEVEEILGKGEEKKEYKIGEHSGAAMSYKGEKGEAFFIYKDDKVVASEWKDK